jgi:ubiquitin C-terminal hydrolase
VKDDSSIKTRLVDCLDKMSSPETLTDAHMVSCDVCQTRTPTTVLACVAVLPEFLMVHLKRFAFDLQAMATVKLNHEIAFDEAVDLGPYTQAGVVFPGQTKGRLPGPADAASYSLQGGLCRCHLQGSPSRSRRRPPCRSVRV